jgi:hypothetical protein
MNEDDETKCDCGHQYCRGYKYLQVDPFASEIHDDDTLYMMCDGEAYESAQDI